MMTTRRSKSKLSSIWLVAEWGLLSQRRTTEVNISLESSWLQNFIYVMVGFNRGQIYELEQIIDCEISCRNRFLWPEIFVNSLTAPYNITTANQTQNEML